MVFLFVLFGDVEMIIKKYKDCLEYFCGLVMGEMMLNLLGNFLSLIWFLIWFKGCVK